MDKSAVKQWVEQNVERIQKEMGLPHWRLNIYYEVISTAMLKDESCPMSCMPLPQYESATIKIDPELHESPEDLEENLRHEFAHIIHSPFELPYYAIQMLLTEEQYNAINAVWKCACEMTVRNIERLLYAQANLEKREQDG